MFFDSADFAKNSYESFQKLQYGLHFHIFYWIINLVVVEIIKLKNLQYYLEYKTSISDAMSSVFQLNTHFI